MVCWFRGLRRVVSWGMGVLTGLADCWLGASWTALSAGAGLLGADGADGAGAGGGRGVGDLGW